MLRILTYNIHHAEGTDGLLDPARIAAVLRESEADVVGLNEVYHPWSAGGEVPLLNEIAEALGMHAVFGAALPNPPGSPFQAPYGNALLSRFPLRQVSTYRLPAPEGRESRGVVAAESRSERRGSGVMSRTSKTARSRCASTSWDISCRSSPSRRVAHTC